jgi:hypothetical protein
MRILLHLLVTGNFQMHHIASLIWTYVISICMTTSIAKHPLSIRVNTVFHERCAATVKSTANLACHEQDYTATENCTDLKLANSTSFNMSN